MFKIVFSKVNGKVTGKETMIHGNCRRSDRNAEAVITIFKNSQNKLETLIHELVHSYLFNKAKSGYRSRFVDQINNDEIIVDGVALHIVKGLKSINKEDLQKCLRELNN